MATHESLPQRRRPLTSAELDVTKQLLMFGPASRSDLGSRLDVSPASMTRVTRSLIDDGIVSESDSVPTQFGRPARLIAANPHARFVLGCKLTATTAYTVVCDLMGEVVASNETPLPIRRGTESVPVETVTDLVCDAAERLMGGRQLDGAGLSLGGIVGADGEVVTGLFLGWQGVDIAGPLRERLGVPVRVTNDVTALAREQLWFGAGRTHSTFALITVGAGIGFGLVRDGVVLDRLIDNGHLMGHSPIDSRAHHCTLGHRGCVSAYLDQVVLGQRASEAFGRPMAYDDIVAASHSGDRRARRILDDASMALAHLACTAAGALQTTRVVLAGEGVAPLAGTPAFNSVIAARLKDDTVNAAHFELTITTEPLTFVDWARGAAVTGIQYALGAS